MKLLFLSILQINKQFKFQQAIRNKMSTFSSYDLKDIVEKLNEYAPLKNAESWDNVGLLIEPTSSKQIKTIFLTNDLTEGVLEEAIEENTDLIISYHPPLFQSFKRLTQNQWKERVAIKCIESRIALYSPHTAWDAKENGINDWLASPFNPISSVPISVGTDDNKNIGSGRLMTVNNPWTLNDYVKLLKQHLKLVDVNVCVSAKNPQDAVGQIKRVAICAGSGYSLLKNVDADLYITGELSHHEALDLVHRNGNVIACKHSNSERGFLTVFKKEFEQVIDPKIVKIIISKTDADPFVTA